MALSSALVLTGAQVRAARAMTGLTAKQLAQAADLSFSTVRRAEDADGVVSISLESAYALAAALEAHGVEFLAPDGDDGGVRYRRP